MSKGKLNTEERISAVEKEEAVTEYLKGKYSQQEICKKFKIKQRSQLRSWIKVYNSHKELRESHGSGTEIYKTKVKKTTQQERAEIGYDDNVSS